MTEQDQIIALAELDGWTDIEYLRTEASNRFIGTMPNGTFGKLVPDYLHSRDAIVPLIEKQFDQWSYRTKFQPVLSEITFVKSQVEHARAYFCATAQQLSEALLRVTGKWKQV